MIFSFVAAAYFGTKTFSTFFSDELTQDAVDRRVSSVNDGGAAGVLMNFGVLYEGIPEEAVTEASS